MICLYQPDSSDPMADFLRDNCDILMAIHEAQDMGLTGWMLSLWVELA